MDTTELKVRFSYHPPKNNQPAKYERLRAMAFELAQEIENLTPISREQSEAITCLEQSIMWANAAIARRE